VHVEGGSLAKRWLKLASFGSVLLDIEVDAEGKIVVVLNPDDKKYAYTQAKKLLLWKNKPLKFEALIPIGER
jgi:hypothetical protein